MGLGKLQNGLALARSGLSAYNMTSQTSYVQTQTQDQIRKRPRYQRAKLTLSTPWQLQTAKARFSELFRRARAEGPQYVTRQGKEAVVVVPAEEFERLTGRTRQPRSLVEFFAASPLAGTELDLKRKADYGRKINL